jgi:hypothetical protein
MLLEMVRFGFSFTGAAERDFMEFFVYNSSSTTFAALWLHFRCCLEFSSTALLLRLARSCPFCRTFVPFVLLQTDIEGRYDSLFAGYFRKRTCLCCWLTIWHPFFLQNDNFFNLSCSSIFLFPCCNAVCGWPSLIFDDAGWKTKRRAYGGITVHGARIPVTANCGFLMAFG